MTIALLIIATGAAVARTVIRYRQFHRFQVDDGFLLLAVLSAISGTAVLLPAIDGVFYKLKIATKVIPITKNYPKVWAHANILSDVAVSLLWLSVFAVKFSFFAFFYRLIEHMNRLKIWWWCCVIITIPLAIADVINP